MRHIAIAIALIVLPATVSAQVRVSAPFYETGQSLQELCSGKELQQAACAYYIAGIHDNAMVRLFGQQTTNTFCFVEKLTYRQLRDVVVDYMNRRPDKLKLPGNLVVQAALQEKYPCKEG
jgi:hypothetical protein